MKATVISPKYQVVIPREIRQALGLKPGQKVQMIRYGNRVELVPLQPLKKMKGFLGHLDTTIVRENDRI